MGKYPYLSANIPRNHYYVVPILYKNTSNNSLEDGGAAPVAEAKF